MWIFQPIIYHQPVAAGRQQQDIYLRGEGNRWDDPHVGERRPEEG